jgi:hypothetical protein
MEETRKPRMGRANTVAANPLKRIPNFVKNPRRDMAFSFDGASTALVDMI